VHIDVDADEVGRNVRAEVGLDGDAKTVLGQLLKALDGQNHGRASRRSELHTTLRSVDAAAEAAWPEPLQLLRDLRARLARDAIVFCDSLIQYWAARHFPVFAPRAMHLPWTFGTLGSSLPMAIGALKILQGFKDYAKITVLAPSE